MIGHLAILLPYLEQESLYDRLSAHTEMGKWSVGATGIPWYKNHQFVSDSSVLVSMFRCPADTLGDMANTFVSKRASGVTEAIRVRRFENVNPGWTNYLGSGGSVNIIDGSSVTSLPNSGIVFENSRIKVAEILDGLSNTILAGEVTGGLGTPPSVPGTIVNARHSFLQNGMGGSYGYFHDPSGAEGFFSLNLRSMFSSFHRGGTLINFAFCDGSTHSYADETDVIVINSLMTRANSDVAN